MGDSSSERAACARARAPRASFFDPLGLSKAVDDEGLAWFRAAELKHGRVAMAAMVGLLVHINGIHFGGYLSPTFGVTFESLSKMGPFDAWNAIPLLGQLQVGS